MSPFTSLLNQSVFYVVYLAWILSFLFERIIISRSGQGKTRIRRDRGSVLIIYASVFLSITIAFTFAYSGVWILPGWVFYLGIGMMLFGIVVREWSVVTLRMYFSHTIRVRENHRVVQNGPYNLVRHPVYSGSMLTVLGLGVALRSWAGVLVLVVLFMLAFMYRIRVEEKLLVGELGGEYVEYMRRTKRLVPFIL
jgi:protein-S-isoprenylcysteine O-methyltransferase Ste14